MAKIKAVLQIYYSKLDRNGNVYWAFRFTDTKTGRSCEGLTPSESNILYDMRRLGFEHSDYVYSTIMLPIRQFDRMVKGWPYTDAADLISATLHGRR